MIGKMTEKVAKFTGIGGAIGTSGLCAVNLMGFKSGGIAVGSKAASMMASATVASGGGVTSGSTVAIL